MPINVAVILGFISAVALTVLAYIFIIPEKKGKKLNKVFKFFHNLFNFKFLFLEQFLKFCYVFTSLYCVCIGFFMIFSIEGSLFYGYGRSLALEGLGVMILGPIVIRIIYESIILIILLVKNVIQINNKLKNQNDSDDSNSPFVNSIVETAKEQLVTPKAPEEPQAAPKFCTKCGATLDAEGKCPNNCQ